MSKPAGRDWRTKQQPLAECEDCNWRCHARNAWGVGVQHARTHDHKVRVEVTTVFIYNDKRAPNEQAGG